MLIALILCVTIGGVYAAWSYAASAGVTETVNKGVSLTPVSQSGSIGSYAVSFAEFSIVIDQTSQDDYTPKLSFYQESDDGSLDFTFTPTTVASDDVKANGIESTVTFTSVLQHEGIAIFSFPQTITIGTADSDAPIKWTKTGDIFTVSISNDALANYIQLNYTNKLDTYAKYQAFETSLGTGTISITVSNAYAQIT